MDEVRAGYTERPAATRRRLARDDGAGARDFAFSRSAADDGGRATSDRTAPAPGADFGAWATLLGGLLVVAGAFLPWISVWTVLGSVSKSGISNPDGVIVFALGALVAVLGLWRLTAGGASLPVRVVTVLLGFAALAALGVDLVRGVLPRVADANAAGAMTASASVGAGIWVGLVGALLGIFGGAVAGGAARAGAGRWGLRPPTAAEWVGLTMLCTAALALGGVLVHVYGPSDPAAEPTEPGETGGARVPPTPPTDVEATLCADGNPRFRRGAVVVVVAATVVAFSDLQAADRARDFDAFAQLLGDGDLAEVPVGTRVVVLEYVVSPPAAKVRVRDGDLAGKVVFVPSASVRPSPGGGGGDDEK